MKKIFILDNAEEITNFEFYFNFYGKKIKKLFFNLLKYKSMLFMIYNSHNKISNLEQVFEFET